MNLKNSSIIVTAITLLFFITLDFFIVGKIQLLAYGGLGAVICLLVAILKPTIITYIYVLGMFIGIVFFKRGSIGVDVTDLLFPFFVLSNLSQIPRRLPVGLIKIIVPLLIFIAGMIISMLFNFFQHPVSLSIAMPWFVYEAIQLPVVIYMLYRFFYNNKERINKAITLLIAASLIQIPLVLYQTIYADTGDVLRTGVHGTFLYHHSLIAMVFLTLLPLFITVLIESKKSYMKLFASILTLFGLYIIVASGSRSLLLGLLSGLGFYVFTNIRWNKQSILILMIMPLVGLFLYFFTPLQDIFKHTFQSSTGSIDTSSLSRLLIWRGSVDNFQSGSVLHKIWGIGAGMYRTLSYDFVIWGGTKGATGAHNNYLHVLLEAGIVGVISLGVHFLYLLKALLKQSKKDLASRLFFFAVIGLLVSGITQETFWFQPAFGSFWSFFMIVFVLITIRSRLHNEDIVRKKS